MAACNRRRVLGGGWVLSLHWRGGLVRRSGRHEALVQERLDAVAAADCMRNADVTGSN